MPDAPSLDALIPAEMARRAEEVGVRKAALDAPRLFMLAVLAGAFIALGAAFSLVAATDPTGAMPWGLGRVVSGLVFSVGLLLVVVGGAELFTGNNLIVMAWASGRVSTASLVRGWAIVLAGNAAGAVGTAALTLVGRHYALAHGAVGRTLLDVSLAKVTLDPLQAVALGTLCNALVCLAVWLSFSARTTVDRAVAVTLPVAAFVACGFEHGIANLYLVPYAILVRAVAPASFWSDIGRASADYDALTVAAFVSGNLLPVTFGNLIGGTLLVGAVYWAVYLRHAPGDGTRDG